MCNAGKKTHSMPEIVMNRFPSQILISNLALDKTTYHGKSADIHSANDYSELICVSEYLQNDLPEHGKF